jgi:hypothetical protein
VSIDYRNRFGNKENGVGEMNEWRNILATIVMTFFACALHGQSKNSESNNVAWSSSAVASDQPNEFTPPIIGYADDRFSLGPLIVREMLDDQTQFSKMWIVQQSQADSSLPRYARIEGGQLHVHDPRGCTVWFTQKLTGPLMISYRVTVPSGYESGTDIVPRDINQFWMANTRNGGDPFRDGGLFDRRIYDGEFGSYHSLSGYYASTGGGTASRGNVTTRMRRYPRKWADEFVDHVALQSRDELAEYQIIPDHEHLVQLVSADDVVQYIFDGRIVYQLRKGDSVDVQNDARSTATKGIWGEEPWTSFQEGYFGFRMTRTHHMYRDFRVYRLEAKH